MKRIRLPKFRLLQKPALTKKAKIAVFGAVIVLGLAAGAITAYKLTAPTPEDQLYTALLGVPRFAVVSERATPDSTGFTLDAKSAINIDNVIKGDGTITCTNTINGVGTVRMGAEIRQVDTSYYMQITGASLQTKQTAAKQQFESYVKTNMAGKWILINDQDPAAMTAKYYDGLMFGSTYAHSSKLSDKQMIALMKQRQLFAITSVQNTTYKGRKARQFNIETPRTTYDSFIDAVQPGMQYKSPLLDEMYGNDVTLKTTVLVDAQTGKQIDQVASTDNLCSNFLGMLGSSLTAGLPERVRVVARVVPGDGVSGLQNPEHAMSAEAFVESLPDVTGDSSSQ